MPAKLPTDCDKDGISAAGQSGAAAASVIDLAHLASQALDDRQLEAELLALFDDQSAQITAQLKALGAGEARLRGDLAHTLRGSALAIGAGEVAQAAQACEACAAGDLRAALDELLGAVARARAAIASLLGRPPGAVGG